MGSSTSRPSCSSLKQSLVDWLPVRVHRNVEEQEGGEQMKRYFKYDENPEVRGVLYYEYDDEYNIRRMVLKNGRWQYASEEYRREYLVDQPLSAHDPETWNHEISREEFEAAWNEAIKERQKKHSFKMILPEEKVMYCEYDGENAVRQVDRTNGQWKRYGEDLRQGELTKLTLSESDAAIWKHEISGEEFEAVWREAIKAEWKQAQK